MSKIKGFTLIELSIALIIVGVLIGMIAVSKNLISQSRINALITEMTQFQSVVNNFKTVYGSLPGDYPNAFATFGSPCTSSCNGNGDGIISWNAGTTAVESLRAWQHMNLAGLYNTSLTGVAATTGQSDIGSNIPASSWPTAGIELYTNAITVSGYGLQVAGFTPSSFATNPIMTTQEAWSLDKKIDDGIGQKGQVLGFGVGSGTTCVGIDNLSYNLNVSGNICYLKYMFNPNYLL